MEQTAHGNYILVKGFWQNWKSGPLLLPCGLSGSSCDKPLFFTYSDDICPSVQIVYQQNPSNLCALGTTNCDLLFLCNVNLTYATWQVTQFSVVRSATFQSASIILSNNLTVQGNLTLNDSELLFTFGEQNVVLVGGCVDLANANAMIDISSLGQNTANTSVLQVELILYSGKNISQCFKPFASVYLSGGDCLAQAKQEIINNTLFAIFGAGPFSCQQKGFPWWVVVPIGVVFIGGVVICILSQTIKGVRDALFPWRKRNTK